MIWTILALGLVFIAVTGMPIGIGLALVGFIILHIFADGLNVIAVTAVWQVFTDFTLSAIPLFILLGEILLVSGISGRLYNAIAPIFERVPGRLLHTNIAVCAVFGAVNGASMSTAAAVGSVAYPELRQRGYDRNFTVATLAAGGTLGILIPPSLSLLIYGATQGVSIGKLFMAGVVPGIMMACLFSLFIWLMALFRSEITPVAAVSYTLREKLLLLTSIWPITILILAIMGSIYLGFATPTESAGLGVVAAMIIGFTWGDLTWRKLVQSLISATFTFASISVIVLGALILAQALSITGLPLEVMNAIVAMDLSRYEVLAVIGVVYLILGCFFDGISLQLMTLPIVYPVLTGLGFDAVWLGVAITIMIEIGMLTPPIGINLFVLSAITKGEVPLGKAAISATPFWLLLVFGAIIITVFPQVALFLPSSVK